MVGLLQSTFGGNRPEREWVARILINSPLMDLIKSVEIFFRRLLFVAPPKSFNLYIRYSWPPSVSQLWEAFMCMNYLHSVW